MTSGIADARWLTLDHDDWARLRASLEMPLSAAEVESLQGLNDDLDMDEVVDAYLPLSRLLNLLVAGSRQVRSALETFLGSLPEPAPYLIGIGGSVAVGKSTTARVLQALIARWPDHPRVELVTTDGFLFPNEVLERRRLLLRKGFPESYDLRALVAFLGELKSGRRVVEAPVYDHAAYDVVSGRTQVLAEPDIVIVEGLNVLQADGHAHVVSDFFDFSIYVDADEADIERWYVERFWTLVERSRDDEGSFFHQWAGLDRRESDDLARTIWKGINGPNLRENIAPTRERAHLVLEKGADHHVRRVRLRR